MPRKAYATPKMIEIIVDYACSRLILQFPCGLQAADIAQAAAESVLDTT